MITVIAWVEAGVEVLPGARVDLGERHKARDVLVPRAAVWLLKSTRRDVAAAKSYARREGHMAFAFPASESDPLGRAKRLALKAHLSK